MKKNIEYKIPENVPQYHIGSYLKGVAEMTIHQKSKNADDVEIVLASKSNKMKR